MPRDADPAIAVAPRAPAEGSRAPGSEAMNDSKFACSICNEPSSEICHSCTKDTCQNHLCARCQRCSDCCSCEVPLDETAEPAHGVSAVSSHSN